MKARLATVFVVLAVMLFGHAQAQERAVIHFADLGGIKDWRPGPDDSLFIEGRNGNWFRATFFGSCYEVKFANAIGFVTDPTGDLDKFSSILVDGRRCWFRTLERTTKPESRK